MSGERLYAVARRYFPDLDSLIPRGAYYEVTLWHKRDRVDVMIMAVHGLDTGKRLVEIPQFDGHVCATGGEQFARGVERNVLYAVGMTF